MNANRQLSIGTGALAKSTEKLASGYRINRAADDAAGLAISEKMRSQVRGLKRASDNAQDGVSLIQTAEGMMDQQHAILQRARELAVQAANGTNTTQDIEAINKEVSQLNDEFTRIQSSTQFNGKNILDFDGAKLQVGANNNVAGETETNTIAVNIEENEMGVSGFEGDDAVAMQNDARSKIDTLDEKIKNLSENRAELGATQNRLEYTIKNDDNSAETCRQLKARSAM
jgi:flagellin